ncbi:hypothetical protein PAHAL_3G127600 [Panicum hallii]|uniref:Uncharacterized protein n=1 Tax=Panicum hallii TaxID=206008 RepID=A0A2T8KI02_9POAL|nr:hypothetical protein PAHAL_3G127600 [Panicum hallii]
MDVDLPQVDGLELRRRLCSRTIEARRESRRRAVPLERSTSRVMEAPPLGERDSTTEHAGAFPSRAAQLIPAATADGGRPMRMPAGMTNCRCSLGP